MGIMENQMENKDGTLYRSWDSIGGFRAGSGMGDYAFCLQLRVAWGISRTLAPHPSYICIYP